MNTSPPVSQEPIPPPLDPTGQSLGEFYAVTNRNRFVTFTPGLAALSTNLGITGIGGGEQIVGLDIRTVDGTVYAFSNLGVLYTLDPRSGMARRVTQLQAMPTGSRFGVEFIAAPEELRVVSDGGSAFSAGGFNTLNMQLQPFGVGIGPLQSTLPTGISEIAGTQNATRCGGTATLYYLDTARDQLLVEDPQGENFAPRTVGPLGVDADASSGFEIFQRDDDSDAAVAVLRVGGTVSVYDIDLSSGRASVRTALPGLRSNETLMGLARPAPQQPRARVGSTVALTASGKLISFDERAPLALCGPAATITGLQAGERLLDIDTRPADGLVYGLSDAARIYTISAQLQNFGAATLKGALKADAADTTAPFDGTIDPTTNIDFDPAADRLVSVDTANRSNRIDVDTALVTTDNFQFLIPNNPFAAGGIGSFAPSPSKALRSGVTFFGIAPPSGAGPFGPTRGFDIRGSDGLFLSVMQPPGFPSSVLQIGESTDGGLPQVIGGGEPVIGVTYVPRPQATVFALTINNRLLVLNPNTPETPDAILQLAGIQPGDTLLAIDFRPSDGALYGLTERGRLYRIDPVSGVATLHSLLTSATNETPFETFVGLEADISFSPTSGQLRVSVSGGRNLRVDVDTGRVITDARLSRATSLPKPLVPAGIAYLTPLSGDTFGKLLVIDGANLRLTGLTGPGITVPSTLREIARLDPMITDIHGFDAVNGFSALLIADTAQERNVLFQVDLGGGNARFNKRGVLPLQSEDRVTGLAATPAGLQTVLHAVLNGQRLITLTSDLQQPSTPPVTVTGLAPAEVLLSIDIDNNANLVGLGSTGRLYFINQLTGTANPSFTLTGDALSGTRFDMDFDRSGTGLAIVSDTGQLLNVDAGGRALAQKLAYANVAATSVAHSNSYPGLPRTTLNRFVVSPRTRRFFIDTVSAALLTPLRGTSPRSTEEFEDSADGDLVIVRSLLPLFDFRSFSPFSGFDVIGGRNALALAALQLDLFDRSMLYRIDVGGLDPFDGGAQPIGPLGPPGTGPIRGLAIRLQ